MKLTFKAWWMSSATNVGIHLFEPPLMIADAAAKAENPVPPRIILRSPDR